MYLVTMDPSNGLLVRFEMTPTQIKHFRVNRASKDDGQWLRDTLGRECAELGTRVELIKDNRLALRWD